MDEDLHPMLPGFGDAPEAAAGRARARLRLRVWVGRGPRAVEASLLEALGSWSARSASDLSLLARPMRIVVPSRSLREHVTGAAMRELGRPLVGVSVQTLYATALEVLERAGDPVWAGHELYSLSVRRRLRGEPSLLGPLGGMADAHRVVEASANDLLDAGFGPEHADALLDALEEFDDGTGSAERARAIARVALAAREELEAAGRADRAQLLERACAALARDPALLPASEVWIHGFAEATGRATDLLLALARAHPTTLLLDEPPEPGAGERVDAGAAFAARLRERFEGEGGRAIALPDPEVAPLPRELLAAPGGEAEVRAVAGRIRALLDGEAGSPARAEPERIGIVVRQLGAYSHALRAHLGRLGIPFSGVGASVASGSGARRAEALSALLEEGRDCGSDRWVELLRGLPGWRDDASPHADLRLGLRHLGAGRLRDVARLEPPEGDLRLPVRLGFRSGADEDGVEIDVDVEADVEVEVDPLELDSQPGLDLGQGSASEATEAERRKRRRRGPTARYRKLRRAVVRAATERARSLCDAIDQAPSSGRVDAWDGWLRARLIDDLGWRPSECDAAFGDGLASALPPGLVLSREEALALLAERLRELETREPLGGRGGGVAVLGAMEARGRTFDHLFVLGLNRDVFPRPIREDPLLPDALRGKLLALLPDLPIKATGHDEERYLFAQLLASSPDVVLSWQSASDDGRERVRSTFVDRLCGNAGALESTSVPPLHHPSQLEQPGRATARELAIWAGIGAERSDYEEQLAGALREARPDLDFDLDFDADAGLDLERLASARAACVREYSRFEVGEASLGPYMGFVGPVADAADLRLAERYVTSLENMARCPWKAMLEKLLRLEAPPDPLESFPELDALTVGQAVHHTLEELLEPGAAEREMPELAEVLAAESRNVPWPADEVIDALAERCAREQLEERGHPYAGLVRVLADRVVAHTARARLLFDASAVSLLGVEVKGTLEVGDGDQRHALSFRADLVERTADGRARLTDYKTGKAISTRKTPSTRAKAFNERVAQGTLLQAVAYALASPGGDATGRYLYLKPDLRAETAEAGFVSGTAEAAALEAAFRSSVSTLARSWDAGVFPPRLTKVDKDEEPAQCGWCELASACLHGDTGMRQRQRDQIAAARIEAAAGELSSLGSRYLALWDLPAATGAPEAANGDDS